MAEVASDFDQVVKEEFEYLIKEYGFSLVKCRDVAGGYEILFTNKTTGVLIEYEFREAYLFVTVYRLVNAVFVVDPGIIEPDTVLNGFSLDDILAVRNPDTIIKPAYEYGADSEFYNPETGLRLYVHKFAENLKHNASDTLRGDFQLFGKLDKIVKERASRLANS